MVQNRKENKVEPLTEELRVAVADLLRDAREAMNNSGAHWVQGTFEKYLDSGDLAFCSVGALDHIVNDRWEEEGDDSPYSDYRVRRSAILALAKDPQIEAFTYPGQAPSEFVEAEWKVITFNDRDERVWDEVEGVFKRTEERLRAS